MCVCERAYTHTLTHGKTDQHQHRDQQPATSLAATACRAALEDTNFVSHDGAHKRTQRARVGNRTRESVAPNDARRAIINHTKRADDCEELKV